jgi:hypothetical protein
VVTFKKVAVKEDVLEVLRSEIAAIYGPLV